MEIKNRNLRKERIGIVTSNSMDKSAVVSVERRVKHRIYGKYIKKTSKFFVHDEKNECNVGDNVSIIESKPISKLKKWTVISNSGDNSWYKCNLNFLLLITLEQEKFNV